MPENPPKLKDPSQPSLVGMTVAFAESPLAVWNQPDGSVTGVTDCAVLQLAGFPNTETQCYRW